MIGASRLSPPHRAGPLRALLCAALAAVLLFGSCGYHVAGKADALPDRIQVIAVPPFENASQEYKIEQHLTRAVVHEFISRTRYRVVADESQADATLRGVVTTVRVFPAAFDPRTGRATTINTVTHVHVALWDRNTGQRLYENPNFEYREQYEVSTDPDAYFEERQSALARTSEAVARGLVSAILEGF